MLSENSGIVEDMYESYVEVADGPNDSGKQNPAYGGHIMILNPLYSSDGSAVDSGGLRSLIASSFSTFYCTVVCFVMNRTRLAAACHCSCHVKKCILFLHWLLSGLTEVVQQVHVLHHIYAMSGITTCPVLFYASTQSHCVHCLVLHNWHTNTVFNNAFSTYTVSQKTSSTFFDCNWKTNYQILIIFGKNIPDTTCHQMTVQFPISPNVCFCTI